jgi:hypothetical protein
MNLYIRIKDGQPFEHPIFEDNFCQAFPDIDLNNLPTEFAKFVRVSPPTLGVYEKNQTVSYQLIDGVYTDVFSCEQMTAQEITEKQQNLRDIWAANNGFASWVLNEATCQFEAPTPKPDDGKKYSWNEETLSWVEITWPDAP